MSSSENASTGPSGEPGPSGHAATSISIDQFTELLAAINNIQRSVDSKLAQFQEEVRQGQEEAAAKALKRARYERPYAFKKRGNEEQAAFNAKVDEALAEAEGELSSIPATTVSTPAVRRMKEAIQKGRSLLEERQKLIRLADRSEHGWSVVDEYTADDLADDSDDERRIEKAERAAERKAGKRRKKRSSQAGQAKFRAGPAAGMQQPAGVMPAAAASFAQTKRQVAPAATRPIGPCHFCGEMGHLRLYCPARATAVSKKWYPSQVECVTGVNVQCSKIMCVGAEGVNKASKSTGDMREVTGVSDAGSAQSSSVIVVHIDDGAVVDGDVTVRAECAGVECGDHVVGYVSSAHGNEADAVMSADVDLSGGLNVLGEESRYYEVDASDLLSPVSVKGRLRTKIDYWREVLQASPAVLNIIESGYVLPLMSQPTPFMSKNQLSAVQDTEFVDECIDQLLNSACIKELREAPYICSPLAVVESISGKKRLVINLRHLNKFLFKQKFKYEDLRVAMLLFRKGDFLFSFDLKSGYHHVDIAEVHHKYLGFKWKGRFFVFTVLPFGLCTACYVFTKLLRPLVRYWRSLGLRIVVYIDDGLCAENGEREACAASQLVCGTLDQAGFAINTTKSVWEPRRRLGWLGFVVDMALGHIEVPQSKITALQSMIGCARQATCIRARRLASILGKIASMSLAFGAVSHFMTRSMYALLESRQSWYETLQLSAEAKAELTFWSTGLEEYNSQPIWHFPGAVRVVYSDASETGYGGYVVEHGPCVAHGQWSAEEAGRSSTWRELSAVHLVLLSVAQKLVNARVRWFTDNQNVARILQVGSRKPDLHAIALKVFNIAIQYQIHLEPEWVPRELNQRADLLSRIVDYDDWFLNPAVFGWLDTMWGPHTVDRFADHNNRQLSRFNSRCWSPGSEAVDAFTVDWSTENNWWCPPVYLVPRVVAHAQMCAAYGTLIVPEWPSAVFWPVLHPTPEQFAGFVVAIQELPLSELLILPGSSGSSLFHGNMRNTKVLALRCDFSPH